MFGNLLMKFYLRHIKQRGFRHGNNFNMEKGVNIDANFCNLISVGNNVTLAKNVYILAHDASMKKFLGKTKVAKVEVGNNVFVGAHTVILPGVKIGDDVVIGANSTVTKSIPKSEVWGGTPAKYIMETKDFLAKHEKYLGNNCVDKNELSIFLDKEMTAYIE